MFLIWDIIDNRDNGGRKMKIIDLTHYISEDMPVYPGTDTPKLQEANTYEKDGFTETLIDRKSVV